MGLGFTEILIIVFVVLLLFGPTKLPKLTKSFGQTIKNFKQGYSDIDVKAKSLPPKDSKPDFKG